MSKPWLAIDAETGVERTEKRQNDKHSKYQHDEYEADAVAWVTRTYFGGRIELCKQGVHQKETYLYDVASAYPSIAVQLPSMAGGKWVWKKNPTRDEIESSNLLSMFRVKTYGFNTRLPFYPLPFRTETESIMFPPEVCGGRYMRDDVIAAFKYMDRFSELGELCEYGRFATGPRLEVSEALFFIPGDENSRPLTFVKELFDWRASLPKDDMRGQVIKLGINSVYGKFAQRVGQRGEPPAYGSLWFAAAITAGTRRKLMEAALCDPHAIIAFATDAVFSTRALPLNIPERKVLGEWEFEAGGIASIAQSGFYIIRKREEMQGDKPKLLKIASRGFSRTGTRLR
jgi:DNA polymerase type B, organellar and viral